MYKTQIAVKYSELVQRTVIKHLLPRPILKEPVRPVPLKRVNFPFDFILPISSNQPPCLPKVNRVNSPLRNAPHKGQRKPDLVKIVLIVPAQVVIGGDGTRNQWGAKHFGTNGMLTA